jgi:hypothetical protein
MAHPSLEMTRIVSVIAVVTTVVLAGAVLPAAAGTGGGTQVWEARDAGPNGAYDQTAGMVASPDASTVYVAASSDGAFVVVAHDAATGARRWSVRARAPGGVQIFAEAVAISPDGTRPFVTGDVEQSINTRSTLTVAYDTSDRSILWSARLSVGSGREAIPRRMMVSPDGTAVFVTGSQSGTHGVDDFWDYFTASYAADSGTLTWTATYDGPVHGGDTAEGLGISADGSRVFVTGTSLGSGTDRDFATVAYAWDGSPLWASRYDAGADDFATDLVVSPDGSRIYVAGFGRASLGDPHGFRTVAYSAATGADVRVAAYDDGGDDMAADVAISDDGSRVVVTGSGSGDFTTVAYDGSLHRAVWSARYDGGHGIDDASAVAVSQDGSRVYVTGESQEGRIACFGEVPSTAFATVEYEAATGNQGWVSRYAGLKKDPDQATDTLVSPDGSLVLVSGNSDFGCASSDVATVAYEA